MTAKEFWEYLCKELNYRFFAGVPCKGLKLLYDNMDAKIMHYIPAVKENVALGLVSGSFLTGNKAAVIMNFDRLYNILDWMKSFNIHYHIPALIIAYDSESDDKITRALTAYKIPYRTAKNLKKDLRYITNKIAREEIPGVLILRKGVLEE